jgi:hypothetical protein
MKIGSLELTWKGRMQFIWNLIWLRKGEQLKIFGSSNGHAEGGVDGIIINCI